MQTVRQRFFLRPKAVIEFSETFPFLNKKRTNRAQKTRKISSPLFFFLGPQPFDWPVGLICYFLTGRQVMLEQPKKSGGKLVSHILASHGGIKELLHQLPHQLVLGEWGGRETGINRQVFFKLAETSEKATQRADQQKKMSFVLQAFTLHASVNPFLYLISI